MFLSETLALTIHGKIKNSLTKTLNASTWNVE